MGKIKLKTLGDIEEKLPEIIPEVGDFVFVIESNGIADSRKREVLFRNRYGVLCQWHEDIARTICHRFFEFEFVSFRIWQTV